MSPVDLTVPRRRALSLAETLIREFADRIDVPDHDRCVRWRGYRMGHQPMKSVFVNGRGKRNLHVRKALYWRATGNMVRSASRTVLPLVCMNPECVNPRHLRDVHRSWGDLLYGRTSLTAADIREIRLCWASGAWQQNVLADAFGLNQAHVTRIVHFEHWPEIDGPRVQKQDVGSPAQMRRAALARTYRSRREA